jgi:L-fuconolactonase
MQGSGLAYDVLIQQHQLPEAIRFIDRHPNQIFVLDHIAKPKIALGEIEPWRSNLLELGKRDNVFCKISGMVTEDSWSDWSIESLRPYLDGAIEAFGPYRLMAGSDWPICLVATDYRHWWDVLDNYLSSFSAAERLQIFCLTALHAYGLDHGGK